MRKIFLLALALAMMAGTGCSLFKEKHVYQEARELPPLQVPEGLDQPNPNSALAVPPVRGEGRLMTEVSPPGMAFQVRQSESGRVLIESQNKLPVLIYFGDPETVEAVIEGLDLPEGWRIDSQSGCSAQLYFADPKAQAVEKMGFFKRVFTREGRVADRSGQYRLQCQPSPGKVQLTMTDAEGSAPPALLVDVILGGIYQALVAREKTVNGTE